MIFGRLRRRKSEVFDWEVLQKSRFGIKDCPPLGGPAAPPNPPCLHGGLRPPDPPTCMAKELRL